METDILRRAKKMVDVLIVPCGMETRDKFYFFHFIFCINCTLRNGNWREIASTSYVPGINCTLRNGNGMLYRFVCFLPGVLIVPCGMETGSS